MRLDTSGRPFGPAEGDEVDVARRQVEQRGAGRAVKPPAPLARAHEQRVAARLRLLPVLAAEDDDVVRLERPVDGLAEVVDEQDALPLEHEVVRADEELRGQTALR